MAETPHCTRNGLSRSAGLLGLPPAPLRVGEDRVLESVADGRADALQRSVAVDRAEIGTVDAAGAQAAEALENERPREPAPPVGRARPDRVGPALLDREAPVLLAVDA